MRITVLATLLMMLAYFLILYGAVGFIQDKRFFGSAPKENLAAIPDKKERFRGARLIGWGIEAVAVLLFAGAAVLRVWDCVRNGRTCSGTTKNSILHILFCIFLHVLQSLWYVRFCFEKSNAAPEDGLMKYSRLFTRCYKL